MHDTTLTGAGLARHVVGYIFGHEPRPSRQNLGEFGVFCEGLLTPPNYLRRDPSNVTDDTEARHTAHTAAGLRHEEAVLPTRILVGKVAVTTFVTHKHPFRRISRIPPSGPRGPLHVSVTWCV